MTFLDFRRRYSQSVNLRILTGLDLKSISVRQLLVSMRVLLLENFGQTFSNFLFQLFLSRSHNTFCLPNTLVINRFKQISVIQTFGLWSDFVFHQSRTEDFHLVWFKIK